MSPCEESCVVNLVGDVLLVSSIHSGSYNLPTPSSIVFPDLRGGGINVLLRAEHSTVIFPKHLKKPSISTFSIFQYTEMFRCLSMRVAFVYGYKQKYLDHSEVPLMVYDFPSNDFGTTFIVSDIQSVLCHRLQLQSDSVWLSPPPKKKVTTLFYQ